MALLTKSIIIDSQTGKITKSIDTGESKQIKDPFEGVASYGETLMVPPLNLEQLTQLAEAHPIHAACLEQKVLDIVASGFNLEPKTPEAPKEQKDKIIKWWESLFEDFTSLEVLQAVWDDYETLGWGAIEIARDINGNVGKLFHMPGHTIRAHRKGKMFAQQRHGRTVWFKLWNTEGTFYASSGRIAPDDIEIDKRANEILIFKKPSRRSSWYGIPIYVSGIGYITLAVSARDFNIKFFDNYREPRHLIIITGLEEDVESAVKNIENIWKTQLENNPHCNVLIPISGDAKVVIEKLGLPINDMHFSNLMEHTDGEILVSHRMPPDRLGIVKRGFLGGSVASITNQIYKDGVASKGQHILESRLQKFVDVEYKNTSSEEVQYKVNFEDLDISDESTDAITASSLVKSNLITLNEGRSQLGKEKHDAFGDMTLSEYLIAIGASPAQMSAAFSPDSLLEPTQKQVLDEVLKRVGQIDLYIEELLGKDAEQISTTKRIL